MSNTRVLEITTPDIAVLKKAKIIKNKVLVADGEAWEIKSKPIRLKHGLLNRYSMVYITTPYTKRTYESPIDALEKYKDQFDKKTKKELKGIVINGEINDAKFSEIYKTALKDSQKKNHIFTPSNFSALINETFISDLINSAKTSLAGGSILSFMLALVIGLAIGFLVSQQFFPEVINSCPNLVDAAQTAATAIP